MQTDKLMLHSNLARWNSATVLHYASHTILEILALLQMLPLQFLFCGRELQLLVA